MTNDKLEYIDANLLEVDLIDFKTFNGANNVFLDKTDMYRDEGFRIAKIQRTDLRDIVGRLVQFTKEVRFYDYIIGGMEYDSKKEKKYDFVYCLV